ncbi:FCD domain-containing protein [Terrilactibacillus sp. BCM23-1]|uniref:FCD domain-containing protein n=1 Tax=Terrilactibacillus tamarindi TaxID=2599694 RepID=A0A6N8CT07_9BACI|nr:FadR/GntR family transcriptional regulator [Terrilactibacillus tamarindi]MTT32808.1 FCD domain-containing protein [Terrilactibacillus tamarindi]
MPTYLLYEKIAMYLEKGISSGKYGLGEKLPSERELSKQYDVSRNVIREAVKLLKEKGLIKVIQGKGSYVTQSQSMDLLSNIKKIMKHKNGKLRDIVEIRELLEQKIVELAVDRATEKQIIELESIVEQMSLAIENSRRLTELDLLFHITLAKCTHNPLFLELMNSISVLLNESIYLLMNMFPETNENVIEQHTQIVKAIKSGNKHLVIKLINNHLILVRKELEKVSFISNDDL